jgi:predicted nuclease of predicted toxin-antitoxin system
VKLLFDQNLSPRLVASLADLFPDSVHVQAVGLDIASDDALWAYALANGFVILTKDEDFNDMSILRGAPPKVLWLQMGNCTTSQIEALLRIHHAEIEAFSLDQTVRTFVLK